jgi:hypothetical protein
MKTLSPQYGPFTPEERLRLALAAEERGDLPEVRRLMDSCPQMPRVVLDPGFSKRVLGMHTAVSNVVNLWVEASAHVLCYGLLVAGLPAEHGALVAKATAEWKTSSAIWRGIESGITKFCADAGLSGDQLLVLANGRSAAVEWARGLLHDDARVDRRCESATRQKLRHAWQGGNEP